MAVSGEEEVVRPITEFRTLPATAREPDDRTTGGTAVGTDGSVDLGTVDTTDEARDTQVRVFWWRVRDMNGASEVSDVRIWLEGAEGFPGAHSWRMDVTDDWTQGKTPVQVETGMPGAAPVSEAAAIRLPAMGGGDIITGTGHADTSRYIYLSGRIGVNEPAGVKTGLRIRVRFRYL